MMKENKLQNDVAKFMDDSLYVLVMPKSKVVCLGLIESKNGMRPVQTENSFKRYSDGMFFIHTLFYKDGTSPGNYIKLKVWI